MIIPQVLTHKRSRDWLKTFGKRFCAAVGRGVGQALQHPVVAAWARESPLLEIAREVLGREAYPYHAALFDKSPDANWLVVWH